MALSAAPAVKLEGMGMADTQILQQMPPASLDRSLPQATSFLKLPEKMPEKVLDRLPGEFPKNPGAIAPGAVFKPTSKKDFAAAQVSLQASDLTGQAAGVEFSSPESGAGQFWDVGDSAIPSWKVKFADGELTRALDLDSDADLLDLPAIATTVASDPSNPSIIQPGKCANPDPELGCFLLQIPTAPSAKPPIMYLLPRLDFFRSNNILSGIDPIDDGLIRPSLILLAVPPLGPSTFLVTSVEGGFSRYFDFAQFDYNELRLRFGIFQQLSPTMSGEIGWTNQQLFISNNKIPGFPVGTRFLNDHAVRLELSRRDQLAKKLFLNSFYQLRVGFSIPEDRSRVINVLFLSLNYDLKPNLQFALDYQFSSANYTQVIRTDLYHQILGRVTYSAFRNTQFSVYGGFSLGSSTEPGINYNSFIVGVSMTVSLVLF
jgi:hypothetical protein